MRELGGGVRRRRRSRNGWHGARRHAALPLCDLIILSAPPIMVLLHHLQMRTGVPED